MADDNERELGRGRVCRPWFGALSGLNSKAGVSLGHPTGMLFNHIWYSRVEACVNITQTIGKESMETGMTQMSLKTLGSERSKKKVREGRRSTVGSALNT